MQRWACRCAVTIGCLRRGPSQLASINSDALSDVSPNWVSRHLGIDEKLICLAPFVNGQRPALIHSTLSDPKVSDDSSNTIPLKRIATLARAKLTSLSWQRVFARPSSCPTTGRLRLTQLQDQVASRVVSNLLDIEDTMQLFCIIRVHETCA